MGDLTVLCAWLRREGETFLADEGLNAFLEAVTACEEYSNFLEVMRAEVGRQAGEAIDVVVPDGLSPGDAFLITSEGTRYEIVVPAGCAPGSVFRAAVVRSCDARP